jgi:hypothetical protein
MKQPQKSLLRLNRSQKTLCTLAFDFGDTFGANIFAFEFYAVFIIAAEYAAAFIFSKDYVVAFNKDLKGIFFLDVHIFAKFHRENYSSEFVDATSDACCFHIISS